MLGIPGTGFGKGSVFDGVARVQNQISSKATPFAAAAVSIFAGPEAGMLVELAGRGGKAWSGAVVEHNDQVDARAKQDANRLALQANYSRAA